MKGLLKSSCLLTVLVILIQPCEAGRQKVFIDKKESCDGNVLKLKPNQKINMKGKSDDEDDLSEERVDQCQLVLYSSFGFELKIKRAHIDGRAMEVDIYMARKASLVNETTEAVFEEVEKVYDSSVDSKKLELKLDIQYMIVNFTRHSDIGRYKFELEATGLSDGDHDTPISMLLVLILASACILLCLIGITVTVCCCLSHQNRHQLIFPSKTGEKCGPSPSYSEKDLHFIERY